MEERRWIPRLKEENEITINIFSGEENLPKEEIPYNSINISVCGAKIQGNILLPVDSIIKIDITLNNSQQKITTIGKVKWNKFIIENGSYEAGVEFVDTSDEEIHKLYKLERIQKDDAFIPKEEWCKLQEINKTVKINMKKCRYCSREIKADVVKCEYCGRTLSGERTDK
jgi:hypothetical protein